MSPVIPGIILQRLDRKSLERWGIKAGGSNFGKHKILPNLPQVTKVDDIVENLAHVACKRYGNGSGKRGLVTGVALLGEDGW
jgi:hypothetical protein